MIDRRLLSDYLLLQSYKRQPFFVSAVSFAICICTIVYLSLEDSSYHFTIFASLTRLRLGLQGPLLVPLIPV